MIFNLINVDLHFFDDCNLLVFEFLYVLDLVCTRESFYSLRSVTISIRLLLSKFSPNSVTQQTNFTFSAFSLGDDSRVTVFRALPLKPGVELHELGWSLRNEHAHFPRVTTRLHGQMAGAVAADNVVAEHIDTVGVHHELRPWENMWDISTIGIRWALFFRSCDSEHSEIPYLSTEVKINEWYSLKYGSHPNTS